MKTKSVRALMLASVLVARGQSFAECKKIEFAELQSMSKELLTIEFCYNKKAAAAAKKQHSELMNIAMQASRGGLHKQAQKYMDDVNKIGKEISDCESEQLRIMQAAKAFPTCPESN